MRHNIMIVPFEAWHAGVLNVRPEQKTATEFYKKELGGTEEYGNAFLTCAVHGGIIPLAYTAMLDGRIVACAGVYHLASYIGEAWALISEEFVNGPVRLKAKVIKAMKDGIASANIQRVQANTEVDFIEAQKFLEALGFEKEGIAKAFNPDGRDSVMYGMAKGDMNER